METTKSIILEECTTCGVTYNTGGGVKHVCAEEHMTMFVPVQNPIVTNTMLENQHLRQQVAMQQGMLMTLTHQVEDEKRRAARSQRMEGKIYALQKEVRDLKSELRKARHKAREDGNAEGKLWAMRNELDRAGNYMTQNTKLNQIIHQMTNVLMGMQIHFNATVQVVAKDIASQNIPRIVLQAQMQNETERQSMSEFRQKLIEVNIRRYHLVQQLILRWRRKVEKRNFFNMWCHTHRSIRSAKESDKVLTTCLEDKDKVQNMLTQVQAELEDLKGATKKSQVSHAKKFQDLHASAEKKKTELQKLVKKFLTLTTKHEATVAELASEDRIALLVDLDELRDQQRDLYVICSTAQSNIGGLENTVRTLQKAMATAEKEKMKLALALKKAEADKKTMTRHSIEIAIAKSQMQGMKDLFPFFGASLSKNLSNLENCVRKNCVGPLARNFDGSLGSAVMVPGGWEKPSSLENYVNITARLVERNAQTQSVMADFLAGDVEAILMKKRGEACEAICSGKYCFACSKMCDTCSCASPREEGTIDALLPYGITQNDREKTLKTLGKLHIEDKLSIAQFQGTQRLELGLLLTATSREEYTDENIISQVRHLMFAHERKIMHDMLDHKFQPILDCLKNMPSCELCKTHIPREPESCNLCHKKFHCDEECMDQGEMDNYGGWTCSLCVACELSKK